MRQDVLCLPRVALIKQLGKVGMGLQLLSLCPETKIQGAALLTFQGSGLQRERSSLKSKWGWQVESITNALGAFEEKVWYDSTRKLRTCIYFRLLTNWQGSTWKNCTPHWQKVGSKPNLSPPSQTLRMTGATPARPQFEASRQSKEGKLPESEDQEGKLSGHSCIVLGHASP